MPIRTAIWKVADSPSPLVDSSLASEQQLEEMIVAAPAILSDEWMLIGRQEDTGYGGRIDLLAIAPDGSLVLIELKRDRTPREVVAQALDYAGWVQELQPEDIAGIYDRFSSGRSLAEDFRKQFDAELDEDALNESHQIVIVAASLDDSTERIVNYLSDREIPINVLCFQVFAHGEERFLSRAWLIDPARTQASVAKPSGGKSEPWNGEFYANYGVGPYRSWDDAVRYGFISAGGGPWYTKTLQLLKPGDRVWVKSPKHGFIGVALVTGKAERSVDFNVSTPEGNKPVLEVATGASYDRDEDRPEEKCEYFVSVNWLQTVPLEEGVQEVGMFGSQHSVCRPTTPRWRQTVEKLKQSFPDWNKS